MRLIQSRILSRPIWQSICLRDLEDLGKSYVSIRVRDQVLTAARRVASYYAITLENLRRFNNQKSTGSTGSWLSSLALSRATKEEGKLAMITVSRLEMRIISWAISDGGKVNDRENPDGKVEDADEWDYTGSLSILRTPIRVISSAAGLSKFCWKKNSFDIITLIRLKIEARKRATLELSIFAGKY